LTGEGSAWRWLIFLHGNTDAFPHSGF
jgi:hypothetical protein